MGEDVVPLHQKPSRSWVASRGFEAWFPELLLEGHHVLPAMRAPVDAQGSGAGDSGRAVVSPQAEICTLERSLERASGPWAISLLRVDEGLVCPSHGGSRTGGWTPAARPSCATVLGR